MTTTVSEAASPNLVDDFEEAFQGIINGFAKEDGLAHTQDNNREELRTDAEQNVSRFIEVAKQLETFFLQRRMQLSVLKPELLVKEDSSELKIEIARKDELIKKHYDKISVWLAMVGDPQAASMASNSGPNNSNSQSENQQMQQPQILPQQQQQQAMQQATANFPNR